MTIAGARASQLRTAFVLAAMMLLQACSSTSGLSNSDAGSGETAAEANMNLGVAYLRRGDYQLAVEKLQKALTENSRSAEAHNALALAYDKLGDEAEAEKHYRRAADLARDNPAIANSYAVFLCRQHEWKKAEPYFQRAATNPKYQTPAVALTNAGTCAYGAGDLERAEQYYRAALKQNDAYPDALAGLMRLTFQQHRDLAARAFMERYMAVRPATAAVLWLCFNLETRLKDSAAANQCATKLTQDFPTSDEFVRLQRLERNAGK